MLNDRAKEVLKQLDNCLAEADRESAAALWAILTALRGPDSVNAKSATTAVIRGMAFPKAANNFILGLVHRDSPNFVETRKILYNNHFVNHAKAAFEALGLKWDELNR